MIMQRWRSTLFTLLWAMALLAPTTWAAQTQTTMTAAIVQSPSSDQHHNFIQALGTVLIKVSGNPGVMTLPAVQASLPHVETMVRTYHTAAPLNQNTNSTPSLVVSFDPAAITQLLTRAGQPMWDAKRPVTLIWLVDQSDPQNPIVIDPTHADQKPVALAMKQVAQSRGLSALFPLMDLSDQALAPEAGSEDTLLSTSQMQQLADRYHVESVLAGVITPVGNQWQASWRYLLDSAPITWQTQPDTVQTLANNALNTVAGTMVAQLALTNQAAPETKLNISVDQVADLTTFANVNHCLAHIPHVTHVTPVDLTAQRVLFLVRYDGNTTAFSQAATSQCRLGIKPIASSQSPSWATQPASSPNKAHTMAPLAFDYLGGAHV
jgi:hypothetical protein